MPSFPLAQEKKDGAFARDLAGRVEGEGLDLAVLRRRQFLIGNISQDVAVLVHCPDQDIVAASLVEPGLCKLQRRLEREPELGDRQRRALDIQGHGNIGGRGIMDRVRKRGRRHSSVAVVEDVVQKIERGHVGTEGRGHDDADSFLSDIFDAAVRRASEAATTDILLSLSERRTFLSNDLSGAASRLTWYAGNVPPVTG